MRGFEGLSREVGKKEKKIRNLKMKHALIVSRKVLKKSLARKQFLLAKDTTQKI